MRIFRFQLTNLKTVKIKEEKIQFDRCTYYEKLSVYIAKQSKCILRESESLLKNDLSPFIDACMKYLLRIFAFCMRVILTFSLDFQILF